jgi:gamma-glutamyltranspeptidase
MGQNYMAHPLAIAEPTTGGVGGGGFVQYLGVGY